MNMNIDITLYFQVYSNVNVKLIREVIDILKYVFVLFGLWTHYKFPKPWGSSFHFLVWLESPQWNNVHIAYFTNFLSSKWKLLNLEWFPLWKLIQIIKQSQELWS